MGTFRPWTAGLVVLLTLTLSLAACKRREAPGAPETTAPELVPSAGAQPTPLGLVVEVTLSDRSIEIEGSLPPGPSVFRIRNSGTTPHGLVLEGLGRTTRFPGKVRPGEVRQLEVILEPGLYSVSSPSDQAILPQQLLVTDRARRP